jgi:hypothetical protein
LIAAGLAGLAGLALGVAVVWLGAPRSEFWHYFWTGLGITIGLAAGIVRTRFSHTCTYVGREGVARFGCSGRRDRITQAEVLCFRDAAELRTSQTLRYRNGIYQGTDYKFTWTDVVGRKRYAIDGTHNSEKGMPPTTDPYHFGRAAEMAWSTFLLGQVWRQIELAESVSFRLKEGQYIRVGPRGLTIQFGGEPVEWSIDEIGGVAVEKGMVKIKRKDAREGWFSSTGVVKFPCESLANARLFFNLLERFAGVRPE